MSTKPRVSSAIPEQTPIFGSAMAHQPGLAEAFGKLYATFWGSNELDHRTKEITRMRNARVTDCGF